MSRTCRHIPEAAHTNAHLAENQGWRAPPDSGELHQIAVIEVTATPLSIHPALAGGLLKPRQTSHTQPDISRTTTSKSRQARSLLSEQAGAWWSATWDSRRSRR
jgi:hypothetical protein